MQVLQWLFKTSQEPPRETGHFSSTNNKQSAKGDRGIIGVKKSANRKKGVERTGFDCSYLSFFKILSRKDVAKACFYNTINLKSVEGDYIGGGMKMTKEDLARGLGMISHKVENKVLPITENDQCSSTPEGTTVAAIANAAPEKKEKTKGDKAKALSKMKELLRWAAAAKVETKGGRYISRKVLQFRNRSALKSVPDDEQMSNDSPKISFRWELESCSTVSSSYSAVSSIASSSMNFDHKPICSNFQPSLSSTPVHDLDMEFVRPGNWITTDSEFVVLEL